jgi:hypothetical protein
MKPTLTTVCTYIHTYIHTYNVNQVKSVVRQARLTVNTNVTCEPNDMFYTSTTCFLSLSLRCRKPQDRIIVPTAACKCRPGGSVGNQISRVSSDMSRESRFGRQCVPTAQYWTMPQNAFCLTLHRLIAPSTAEVKKAWSYTSTPPYVFMAWCLNKYRIRLHSG